MKLLDKLMTRRDTEAFREPVQHEALGLIDYLTIVKRPMDLGTVKQRLSRGYYEGLHECSSDIRLVWANAMLYNQPGSAIHQVAQQFSDDFESKYAVIAKEDSDKPPSMDEMKVWAEKFFRLTPEQSGIIIMSLEKVCPRALTRSSDGEEVDVNIDLLPGTIFRGCMKQMDNFLPTFEPAGYTPPKQPAHHTPLPSSQSAKIVNNTSSAQQTTSVTAPSASIAQPVPASIPQATPASIPGSTTVQQAS